MPTVTKEEIKKALEALQRGKAAGGDQITEDPLKDGGQILLEKLATLYTQCLTTSTVPQSWKNEQWQLSAIVLTPRSQAFPSSWYGGDIHRQARRILCLSFPAKPIFMRLKRIRSCRYNELSQSLLISHNYLISN